MQPFTIVKGVAAPIPAANIDTDVIMPKQFLKGVDRSGLRDGVFHELRFDPSGAVRPDFILNRAGWRNANFLIVGPNFGCGSSREHAVWGLVQLGIRAVIGSGFAGIFFDNCARNGLLAVTLDDLAIKRLSDLAADPETNILTVNLMDQAIMTSNGTISFDIEPDRKQALILGLDPIATTLKQRDAIVSFEQAHLARNPWFQTSDI